MEMLPEDCWTKKGRLLREIQTSDSMTCFQFGLRADTERNEIFDCIVGIDSSTWRQISNNYRSHLNHFIAGPVEEIVGGGTLRAIVEAVTEAAVTADKEVTAGAVEDVREEPMLASITESQFELEPIGQVWRDQTCLKTHWTPGVLRP